MKKNFRTAIICTAMFCVLTVTVSADMGSKPRVEIIIENAPVEEYYLDLLYQHDGPGSTWSNIDEDENYNQKMVEQLFTYEDEGWIPAYAGGTNAPVWGSLTANDEGKHIFSYVGVPDVFKVIIVTESGQLKVSDIIERKAMEANLTLDYSDMTYTESPLWQVYLGQFTATCSITMIVELIILILFRFKIKKNLAVFFATNFITQIIFTLLFASAFIFGGTLGSLFAFIPLEVGVTLAEAFIYRKWLEGHTMDRRLVYAVTANIATAALTWVNMDSLMDFMFQLMR